MNDRSALVVGVTDMTKSRLFGVDALQVKDRSFTDLFERLRAEKIVPPRA